MTQQPNELRMAFNNIHKGLLAGLVSSSVPQVQKAVKFAAIVEENETLILNHRGKYRLDELKHAGITTLQSYYDIIQYEADKIRGELILKNLW